MAKAPTGVCLFFLCLLLAACTPATPVVEPPQARQGLLDLQGWDFDKNGQVGLMGEWEFYWRELLTPAQIETASTPQYVVVPESWTSYAIDGEALPPEGFATYRLQVQLDELDQIYAIYIDGEGTAYTLWVDGKQIAQNGRVGTTAQDMLPQSQPQIVLFQPSTETTEFIIQISNFNHRKAGFRNELIVGLSEQIYENQREHLLRDAALMGVYFVMAAYHLCIYGLRPANKSVLHFAIWSFVFFIRTGLLNQKLIFSLFPAMSWEFALRLEYLTFYMVSPIYALFVHSLFPKDMPRWVLRTVIGLGVGFTLFMFLVDTLTASQTVTLYQGVILIEIAYFVLILYRIFIHRRDGAVFIVSASAIGFTSIVLEILSLQKIISIDVDGTMTFLAFVVLQAIMLASILSRSFKRVESLSTELQAANTNLQSSERKYRSIFEKSRDMIFVAGLDEQIKDANPSSEELLGYTQDELRGMKMSDLVVHDRDKEKVESLLREHAMVRNYELELKRKDGDIIHGLVTLTIRRDENGQATEFQGNVHDISSRIEAELERSRALEFEQLAITDPLTGIYNRRVFDEIAHKEWERAKRGKAVLSVVLFDVDHFKRVNDSHGHLIGDQVLVNLAALCSANLRNMDIFARYGGEEFVILMPDADQASALQSMERLRQIVESSPVYSTDGLTISLTISAGVVSQQGDEFTTFEQLLERADQALYTSKKMGRNRVTVWNSSN